MPRGDGTGPMGAGPMTGRGAGFCAGYVMPGHMNAGGWGGPRMGFGRGAEFRRGAFGGGGYGWRNRFFATGLPGWMRSEQYREPYMERDPELEKRFLKAQMESLQRELDIVKRRLAEKEKSSAAE